MLDFGLYYQLKGDEKPKKVRDIEGESRNKEETEAITLQFE